MKFLMEEKENTIYLSVLYVPKAKQFFFKTTHPRKLGHCDTALAKALKGEKKIQQIQSQIQLIYNWVLYDYHITLF